MAKAAHTNKISEADLGVAVNNYFVSILLLAITVVWSSAAIAKPTARQVANELIDKENMRTLLQCAVGP